jgi:hypothetical protein
MSTNPATLTDQEIADLHEALTDEHKARATYRQVIEDFGDVRPFANIVNAEQRHIDALVRMFERYGVPVPADPWPGPPARYGSISEACADAAQAELDNAALYNRILANTQRPDLTEVYQNLQRASRENHLPAFQRCVQRGHGGGGRGGGGGSRGRGGGHRGGSARPNP